MDRTVPLILACLLLAFAPAQGNLIVNGDFEQDLTVGWLKGIDNIGGEYSFDRWDTMGQSTPGYAARVYKYLAAYASLGQTVDVPGADLDLSFEARFRLAGGSSTCWPVGAFVVSYLAEGEQELGSTMFILRNEYCDWVESDTLHFIDVTRPGEWVDYNLDIRQEITDNLPGVDVGKVYKIRAQIYSYVNGT